MNEPTDDMRDAAKRWAEKAWSRIQEESSALVWAHYQLDGRLLPEIQDVTRNYAAKFAAEAREDGFAYGMMHAAKLIANMYERQGRPNSADIILSGEWLEGFDG